MMAPSMDQVVVWLNVGFSAFAAAVLFLAAFGQAMPELRPIRFAGGVLASIYCGAYIWLAFNLDDAASWSQYVRPLGVLAWPIVWIYPPIVSARVWRQIEIGIAAAHEGHRP